MGFDETISSREDMISTQLIRRGIEDPRVLQAMLDVPRHRFVSDAQQKHAYEDRPLSIGLEQTISQPFIVAFMVQVAQLPPDGAKVLEIGTGSGYGAAILGQLAAEVHSLEILPEHAQLARERLSALGWSHIHVHCADGSLGWEEQAPYDAILATAAPVRVPLALTQQLKIGGSLVIPVGEANAQELRKITRLSESSFHETSIFSVRFVPMTGECQRENL